MTNTEVLQLNICIHIGEYANKLETGCIFSRILIQMFDSAIGISRCGRIENMNGDQIEDDVHDINADRFEHVCSIRFK